MPRKLVTSLDQLQAGDEFDISVLHDEMTGWVTIRELHRPSRSVRATDVVSMIVQPVDTNERAHVLAMGYESVQASVRENRS